MTSQPYTRRQFLQSFWKLARVLIVLGLFFLSGYVVYSIVQSPPSAKAIVLLAVISGLLFFAGVVRGLCDSAYDKLSARQRYLLSKFRPIADGLAILAICIMMLRAWNDGRQDNLAMWCGILLSMIIVSLTGGGWRLRMTRGQQWEMNVFRHILNRPAMYVGIMNMEKLCHYLEGHSHGYSDGRGLHWDSEEIPLNGFQQWVEMRFLICQSAWHWPRILLHTYGSDEAALKALPSLYEEFLEDRKRLGVKGVEEEKLRRFKAQFHQSWHEPETTWTPEPAGRGGKIPNDQ